MIFHTAATAEEAADLAKRIRMGTFDQSCEGLISKDPLFKSLRRLSDLRALAADFDGTCAPGSHWESLNARLPESLRDAQEEDRLWYFTKYLEGTGGSTGRGWQWGERSHLDPEHAAAVEGAFIARQLGRFQAAEFSKACFESAGKKMRPRQGLASLFLRFKNRLIVSMGIVPCIKAFLKENGLEKETRIAATSIWFPFHKDTLSYGKMSGYGPVIMSPCGKPLAIRQFIADQKLNPEQLLILGDSIGDVPMMLPGVFGVFLIPHDDSPAIQQYREKAFAAIWNRADLLVIGNSIEPLADLVYEAAKTDLFRDAGAHVPEGVEEERG